MTDPILYAWSLLNRTPFPIKELGVPASARGHTKETAWYTRGVN